VCLAIELRSRYQRVFQFMGPSSQLSIGPRLESVFVRVFWYGSPAGSPKARHRPTGAVHRLHRAVAVLQGATGKAPSGGLFRELKQTGHVAGLIDGGTDSAAQSTELMWQLARIGMNPTSPLPRWPHGCHSRCGWSARRYFLPSDLGHATWAGSGHPGRCAPSGGQFSAQSQDLPIALDGCPRE